MWLSEMKSVILYPNVYFEEMYGMTKHQMFQTCISNEADKGDAGDESELQKKL